MTSYESVITELYRRFPSVQTHGFSQDAFKPGLERMRRIDLLLGTPSSAFRSVHVAGTNGKGSVSSMIASCLAAEGLKVGLYTSPHLVDFRERIKVVTDSSFECITEEEVLSFAGEFSDRMEGIGASFFEMTTGMAFRFFADRKVDVAVVETGLGGRLDSTNIIEPEISIITSIGLDHCAQLGDTRAEIAFEKAGIFKPGIPALVWGFDDETGPVFEKASLEAPCPLFYASDFDVIALDSPDLRGEYQDENIRTVCAALELMGIEPSKNALEHAASRTGFRGRWEILSDTPLTICDIGHNAAALEWNFSQLKDMMAGGGFDRLIIVYGIMADKNLDAIIPLMPQEADYIFTTPPTPRARDSRDILARFEAIAGINGASSAIATSSVREAISKAWALSSERSLVYIGGSTYVVAEAIKMLSL